MSPRVEITEPPAAPPPEHFPDVSGHQVEFGLTPLYIPEVALQNKSPALNCLALYGQFMFLFRFSKLF